MRTPGRLEPFRLLLFLFALNCAFPSLAARAHIRSAHLASRDLGWAVVDTHVWLTTNGGSKWTDVTPPYSKIEFLADVAFVDRRTGYVSFLSPYVIGDAETEPKYDIVVARTTDGGLTWQKATLPRVDFPTPLGAALTFFDSRNGWVLGPIQSSSNFRLGMLFATKDGGKTWRQLPDPQVGERPYFTTRRTGWLAGGPAGMDFWRTDDGGFSWKAVTVPYIVEHCVTCRPVYENPLFIDKRNGWLTVTFYTVEHELEAHEIVHDFRTHDGGRTWVAAPQSSQSEDEQNVGYTVETPDGPIRIRSAMGGKVTVTHRGVGQTATIDAGEAQPWDDAGVTAVGFINALEGWVIHGVRHCGNITPASKDKTCPVETQLLSTRDGGRSWKRITPETQQVSPAGLNGTTQTDGPKGQ